MLLGPINSRFSAYKDFLADLTNFSVLLIQDDVQDTLKKLADPLELPELIFAAAADPAHLQQSEVGMEESFPGVRLFCTILTFPWKKATTIK